VKGYPTLGLTLLYLRSSIARMCIVLATATIALATTGAIAIVEMTRTPQQYIAHTVGAYDYSLSLAAALPPGDSTRYEDVIAAALQVDAASDWGVTATDLPVDGAPQGQRTQYQEFNWAAPPLPDRHSIAGRWPLINGEVAASSTSGATIGDTISLFGGRQRVTVVGIAEDKANRFARTIFGVRGQWESWVLPDAAALYPNAVANVEVFWHTTTRDEASARLASSIGLNAGAVDQFVQDRARLATARRDIASVLLPITGVAPALLFPALAGLSVGLFLGAWNRRTRHQLIMLGIPSAMARDALYVSAAFCVVAGWVLGTMFGLILGWAIRPLLEAHVAYELAPWGPGFPYPLESLLLGLAGAGVGAAATPALQRGLAMAAVLGRLRRPAAGAAALALVVLVPLARRGIDVSNIAVLVTGITALLAPDAVGLWLRFSNANGSPARVLGGRLLAAQRRFANVAIASLVAIQTAMGSGLGIAVTQVEVANAAQVAQSPPGYIKLQSLSQKDPVPDRVVKAFESETGLISPIIVWSLVQTDISPQVQGRVILVRSIDDLERLAGTPMSAAQKVALQEGLGMISPEPAARATLSLTSSIVSVETARVNYPRELQAGGIALSSATFARGQDIEFQALYYQMDQGLVESIAPSLSQKLGIDPSYIKYFRTPTRYTMATSVIVALAGFALMATLVFAGFVSAVVRHARPYLATLTSLGLPRSWGATLLAWIVGPLLLGAAAISLVGVSASSLLVWMSNPAAFRVLAPLESLLAILIVSVAGGVVGVCGALLGISVRDRHFS